jgi:hypothetical protein
MTILAILFGAVLGPAWRCGRVPARIGAWRRTLLIVLDLVRLPRIAIEV